MNELNERRIKIIEKIEEEARKQENEKILFYCALLRQTIFKKQKI